MGVVYRAEDRRLKRKVALKLLAPDLAEDERFRERFLRESELAASLDHPSIIPIYEAGEVEGQLYIAMRYVEGGDIKRLIRTGLEPRRALELLAQVADALDAAHEAGLLHRDVKPANVLLDAREHCYLADFGLTKQISSQSGLTATGEIAGTVDYVAPEVIEGKTLDARADLYSFGCLLFECLSGRPPFHRDSEFAVLWAHVNDRPPKVADRRPDLAPAIDAVLARALAKDPRGRFESARKLVQAVEGALPREAPRPRRRRRLLAAAIALAATLLAVALALALTGRGGGTNIDPTIAPLADSVQHVDPATNRLVATLPGGPRTSTSLAVAQGAIWTGTETKTVLRVEAQSGRTIAAISLGSVLPGEVGVTSDGEGKIWASTAGIVMEVDPVSNTITRTLAGLAVELAWSSSVIVADPGNVWVDAGTTRGNIAHYSTYSEQRTAFFAGPGTPVAMTLGSGSLWVSEYGFNELVRVDPDTGKRLATIDLPFEPVPQGLASGSGSIWLTNAAGGRLLRIDPRTNRIAQRIRVGRYPTAVAWGAGSVWVANNEDGTLMRVDPRSGRVVATIPVGPRPTAVAVGAGGVWVAVHPA